MSVHLMRFVAVRINGELPIISSPAYSDRDGLEKIHQWLLENGRQVQVNRGGWLNVYCYYPSRVAGGRIRRKTHVREDREAQERMNLYHLARWDRWENPVAGFNGTPQMKLDLMGLETIR